jgi:hypothetical protein
MSLVAKSDGCPDCSSFFGSCETEKRFKERLVSFQDIGSDSVWLSIVLRKVVVDLVPGRFGSHVNMIARR